MAEDTNSAAASAASVKEGLPRDVQQTIADLRAFLEAKRGMKFPENVTEGTILRAVWHEMQSLDCFCRYSSR